MANENPYAYKNVVAAETVTLRGGANLPPGVLGIVCVNTAGTGTIQIFDNTAASGTLVANITATVVGYYEFDAQMVIGLTYIRSAGDGNITISYR